MGYPIDFWYCICIDSIMIVCSAFYVIYYISYYAHPNDTKWGSSLLFRGFIFLGYMIQFTQIFAVQFDILFYRYGIESTSFWTGLQIVQLCFVFIAVPLLMVLYESNEH